MAIRTWNALGLRPTYGYFGLAVVAQALGRTEVTVIADARRSLWHRLAIGGAVGRVPASELAGELATPEGFRHWDPLPPGTIQTPYNLADLFALESVAGADLFRTADSPDAFLHQQPSYAKWVPHIHSAP